MKVGVKIHHYDRCASTNDVAREMALQGAAEGVVVIAEEQTAGRGTKGRSWDSAKGRGLYLSVILRPPAEAADFLPLMTGVAVREALTAATGLAVGLKWPNDLLVSGKKLGGVLCESFWTGQKLDFAVVGVGLNLLQDEADFPLAVRPRATSVQMESARPPKLEELLEQLFARLDFWYGLLRRGKRENILKEFEKRMVLPASRKMTVLFSGGKFTGFYRGLRPDGGINLESEGLTRSFAAAEIMELIYDKG
jgi:BirA family biotin operon repressor/biotin-[acetyl-CoA-carboxylase] ligase